MKLLTKEEQFQLDVREAELKDFIDKYPRARELQKELDLKLVGVPDEKRLEVIFMLMAKSMSDSNIQLDKLENNLRDQK